MNFQAKKFIYLIKFFNWINSFLKVCDHGLYILSWVWSRLQAIVVLTEENRYVGIREYYTAIQKVAGSSQTVTIKIKIKK
jgi:hypothetical protein